MAESKFERIEKKYLLSEAQYIAVRSLLTAHMKPDSYGAYTISNIYYDTPDYRLIRTSLEKPRYKEKLRLRCYGVPDASSTVFLELKKKVNGVVYKRRTALPLVQAEAYLAGSGRPGADCQILREIDWFLSRNAVMPKIMLSYDRSALYGLDDRALRVTFDRNIRFRQDALSLACGSAGTPILPADTVLMEIKIPGAMPCWMAKLLSQCRAYPSSFSKYGRCYADHIAGQAIAEAPVIQLTGGTICA